jgi:circadian clock protein KaiC
MDRLTTGIAGLDRVLSGGLPKGALVFIGGAPGTGKTLLCEQIAFHEAAAGRASLIVTALSEPHEKLIRHAEEFRWFDWARIGQEVEFLSLYQTVLDEGLRGAMDLIVRTTHERHASTLIFDGFRGLRDLAGDELAVRRFIFELGGKLGLLGATTLLVGEYARDEVERYPEFTIADSILCLSNDLVGVRHERRLEVVKLRGSGYLGGRHRFEITPDGTVFPRQATLVPDADYRLGADRLPIGVAGLDAMIGGGLREHSVSLLLGTPGTGKTILALQFLAQGARHGERGVFVTFHESPSHLRDQAESLGIAGPDLFENGAVQILYESPIELNADRVAARVREVIAQGGVRRLAIDSLTNLEAELEPNTQSDYLIGLTTYLRMQEVTTLMLKEIPELAGGPLTLAGMTVSVTVDNILLLRHVELDGQLERIVTVIKIRDSDFDARVHRYRIDAGGLVLGEPLAGVEGILIGLARLRSESAPPSPLGPP